MNYSQVLSRLICRTDVDLVSLQRAGIYLNGDRRSLDIIEDEDGWGIYPEGSAEWALGIVYIEKVAIQ